MAGTFSRADFQRAIEERRRDLGPRYNVQSASVTMPIAELWALSQGKAIANLGELFPLVEIPIRDFLAAYEPKPLDPATGSWRFTSDEFCLGLISPIRVEDGVRGACAS